MLTEITWLPDVPCRAFVDPDTGRASIVAARLGSEPRARRFGDIVVVADGLGFCDVEAAGAQRMALSELPDDVDVATSTVGLRLPDSHGGMIRYGDDGLEMVLGGEQGEWITLAGAGVQLRVMDRELRVVKVDSVTVDRDGSAESEWLDSFAAG